MSNIKLFVRKQLAEDIERLGGLHHFINKDPTDQSLCKLFDTNKAIYGDRGSDIRKQLRNLVKRWAKLSSEDYQTKVIFRFQIKPHTIDENKVLNEEETLNTQKQVCSELSVKQFWRFCVSLFFSLDCALLATSSATSRFLLTFLTTNKITISSSIATSTTNKNVAQADKGRRRQFG